MTRFQKIYSDYKYKHELNCKIAKNNSMNREGYGYIKRRVGLLSAEVGTPTYMSVTELSNLIQTKKRETIAHTIAKS